MLSSLLEEKTLTWLHMKKRIIRYVEQSHEFGPFVTSVGSLGWYVSELVHGCQRIALGSLGQVSCGQTTNQVQLQCRTRAFSQSF